MNATKVQRRLAMNSDKVETYIKKSVAVILVGGRSRRMHFQDKMNLRIGEESFLERILRELSIFNRIIISANKQQIEQLNAEELSRLAGCEVMIVEDQFEDIGPLGGLYSAMCRAEVRYYFLVPCDMPLIRHEVVGDLYDYLQEMDQALVPEKDGRLNPLFAIYRNDTMPQLKEQIETGDYKVLKYCDRIACRYVEIDEKGTFININTPEGMKQIL